MTDVEKQQILMQLMELEALRLQVKLYKEGTTRDREQDARDRQNYEKALELAKQEADFARRERDLQAERATLYESLWKAATKKPGGVKHTLCKIFTLGLARCGT